jgi:hypothetical protein
VFLLPTQPVGTLTFLPKTAFFLHILVRFSLEIFNFWFCFFQQWFQSYHILLSLKLLIVEVLVIVVVVAVAVIVQGPAKIIYHFNTFPTVTLYS